MDIDHAWRHHWGALPRASTMEDRLPLDQYLELPSRVSLQEDDQGVPPSSDNTTQEGSVLTMRQRKKSATSTQPIDYVLVYKNSALDKPFVKDYRERFLTAIQNEKIEIQKEIIEDFVYVKLTVAFDRLCKQATFINLEMPLKDVSSLTLPCVCLAFTNMR